MDTPPKSARRFREPLILPFAAVAAGIAIGFHWSRLPYRFTPREALEALGALAALSLAARSANRRTSQLAALAAIFFAGVLLVAMRASGPPPRLSVPDNSEAILEGCVVDPALIAADRERFAVELAPGARAQVTLFAKGETGFPELPYGARIEFEGKARSTHNFANPGSFDAVEYFARQNVYWNISGAASSVKRLNGSCGNPLAGLIFALRTAALDRLDQLYADDPYTNGMMQAILIGATAHLERMWTEDYRSTGTFHALVISGSHVAVLAAVFLFLLRLCAVPRAFALAATLGVAWLYAGIAGWQAPVLRSAAGMTLFAFGGIFYRKTRLLNILAAVALLFVVWEPEQLFDAGFQLSFLAVALIGAFVAPIIERTSAPLARGLSRLEDTRKDIRMEPRSAQFRIELRLLVSTLNLTARIPDRVARALVVGVAKLGIYLWDMVVASFFIQLGLTLPMIAYFHRVSFSGLSANAIVVPVLTAVVPLGFAAIVFNSHLVAGLCAWLLTVSRWAVGLHARWEPDWRIPAPPWWLAALFAATLVAAAMRFHGRPLLRFAAWAGVAVTLAAMVAHPFAPLLDKGVFELSAIDVGQGDSLLAAFPDGRLMLVDAGGIPSFGRTRKAQLDIGEDVVSPYLWSRSIRRLDVVAMTHAHEDHMGGMSAVLRNFRPTELWTGAVQESPEWKGVRETALRLHIRIRQMRRSDPFDFGGATIRVLAPGPDYLAAETPKNDDSLVMRIGFGSTAFLLAGDMEKRVEKELYYAGLLERAEVLKVGHHGSRTSSTPEFLDAVHPAFGVISDGFDNSYGHPHPLTMSALEERHVKVFRTDERGLVRITSDGLRIRVE